MIVFSINPLVVWSRKWPWWHSTSYLDQSAVQRYISVNKNIFWLFFAWKMTKKNPINWLSLLQLYMQTMQASQSQCSGHVLKNTGGSTLHSSIYGYILWLCLRRFINYFNLTELLGGPVIYDLVDFKPTEPQEIMDKRCWISIWFTVTME